MGPTGYATSKANPLTIQLVGGLGNQLFGYFAGIYWANINGGAVRFIRSSQENHSSKTRSCILDFNFPRHNFVANTRSTRLKSGALDLTTSIRKALGRGRPIFSSIWGVPHYSGNLGFDSELANLRPGTMVQGFFQTHKYWSALNGQGLVPEFCVREPSKWFLTYLQKIEEERPIVLHIRRGDYRSHSTSIGLLGQRYFSSALETAKEISPSSRVWLFSDEPDEVQSEFPSSQSKHFFKLDPPPNTSAAEVMMLMSKANVKIVSNSTFSWWGATLGKGEHVIAPSKWFKSGNDPEELMPSDWTRIQSYWE